MVFRNKGMWATKRGREALEIFFLKNSLEIKFAYFPYLIRSWPKKLSIIVSLIFRAYSLNSWNVVRFSKQKLPITCLTNVIKLCLFESQRRYPNSCELMRQIKSYS